MRCRRAPSSRPRRWPGWRRCACTSTPPGRATTSASPATASIRFTPRGYEGLHFHHSIGFDTSGYDHVSLWVNGGGSGAQKLLMAARYSGTLGAALPLEQFLQGGLTAIPKGAWAQALV